MEPIKQVKLNVISIKPLAEGKYAVLTKIGANNPSSNGVHVMNAGQIGRIALRAIGVESAPSLMHAINISNGSAVLTMDSQLIKAGDVWENKVTGETGIHKGSTKEGHIGEPYTKYSNHEIELGFAASQKMLEVFASAAIANAAQFVAAPKVTRPALGITADVSTEVEEPTV